MIIDINTQIWSSAEQLGVELAEQLRREQSQNWEPCDASTAAHEQAMRCVDGSLVLGFHAERIGAQIPNEFIAEFVARDQQRRVGFAGIDPMCRQAPRMLNDAAALGLSGVAISPAFQGFHPQHSAAMQMYEACADRGLPVFVTMPVPCTAGAILEFARPILWDEVARALPNLSLIISQLGYPWIDETLVLLSKHENVYADLSGVASRPWQLYTALQSALSLGVMDKLFFGSGFPRHNPAKTIEALYSINSFSHGSPLPSIPRTQIRGIVERDSLTCLGIDAIITPRATIEIEDDALNIDRTGRMTDRRGGRAS